jgi:hypothetical protein
MRRRDSDASFTSNATMESSQLSRRMTCITTTVRTSLMYSILLLCVILCCNVCQSYSFVVPVSPLANNRIQSFARSERTIAMARTAPSISAASRRPFVQTKSTTTKLHIAATSVYSTAALISTLSGGLFSGGLHAIAGRLLCMPYLACF